MRRAHPERPPRLVLRFVAVTAVCLGAAAAAILLTTRHLHTVQAERASAAQARLLAETLLGAELVPTDLDGPVRGSRRATLDGLLERRVLRNRTALVVTVVAPSGLVTYSTDHSRIGRRAAVADRPAGDAVTSRVERIRTGAGRTKVLRSTVPLDAGGRRATAVVDQDYGTIEAAAQEAFLPVAGILELVLVALLGLLVPLLARVTRRLARQVERIREQATHDALTGLPNRVLFDERLAALLAAPETTTAVVLLDVDRFREINDTLGHAAGDELLRIAADRLRAIVAATDTLARLGGDEFGVLATGRSSADALELARTLRAALAEPLVLDGVPVAVEAATGVAVGPDGSSDPSTLLRSAEVAMYSAKSRRVGVVEYRLELETIDRERLALVGELPRALEEGEIVLHYQPKVDLGTGELCGVEALVRWAHPVRGLLGPGEFLSLAERTELMRPLTGRVLELAAAQAAAWRRAGTPLQVAVNVTMGDLVDDVFPAEIQSLLDRNALEPGALALEITESTMMSEPERVRDVLARLARMGVTLAIDDFGTGYSSLGYLRELPVHVLKIDRSFVTGMTQGDSGRAIVRATVELAHALGLEVVAEGVETEDVRDELRALGCEVGQGWLFGKPVPADELAPRVRSLASAA